jgi:sugar lactone lactonase YvrE
MPRSYLKAGGDSYRNQLAKNKACSKAYLISRRIFNGLYPSIVDPAGPQFDVDIDKGTVSNSKVFAEGFAPGLTDGMRCDIEGNVWCSMGWADPKEDGVRCYTPAGELIGKIHLPETCANLVFGGPLRNRLYMCASTSVYAAYVNVQGAAVP